MDTKESVERYLRARDSFLEQMGPVTRQLDEWVDLHLNAPATLADIARFEGLRTQRTRLLAEFGETEDRFVVELLERLAQPERRVRPNGNATF
jgi:hypothetical protein